MDAQVPDISAQANAGTYTANNISNGGIPSADFVQAYAIQGFNLNKSYTKTKYLFCKDKDTKILDNLTINVAKGKMLVHFNFNCVIYNKYLILYFV